MSAAQVTNWELRLKDYVLNPLKRISEYSQTTQKKINDVQKGFDNIGKASTSSSNVVTNAFDRIKRAASSASDRISGFTGNINNKLSAFKNHLKDSAAEIPGLSNGMRMLGNPALLIGAGALAAGVYMQKSVRMAADYQEGMAKINATAQLSSTSLGKLKDRLQDIGSHSGGNFELMPSAYEKILSQTGRVNMSLDILETSVKGAKAGFTDIDTVAGALAQTMSAVGEGNASASQVLDTFLKAKALGAGEFSDFANYMPSLIASAKNVGIVYKDTAGLFSYMTAKGNSAADSAMLLQNAFTALSKKEVMQGLGKKGINLFDAHGMRRNIKDIFLELSTKLSKLSDRGRSKFLIDIGLNDAQARQAFSVLTSESDKFKSIMEGVNNAVGETKKQLESTGNIKRSWAEVNDEFKNIGETIGEILLPAFDNMAKEFTRDISFMKLAWRGLKAVFLGDKEVEDKFLQIKYGMEASTKNATIGYKHKYGVDISQPHTQLQQDYYDALYAESQKRFKEFRSSKNNIDKNEKSPAAKALKNVNNGLSPSDTGIKETKSEGSVGGNAPRILTMNLDIKNYITANSDLDLKKLRDDIMDEIVDAARDGLATIGA